MKLSLPSCILFILIAAPALVFAQSSAIKNSIIEKFVPRFDPVSGFNTINADLYVKKNEADSLFSFRSKLPLIYKTSGTKVIRNEIPFYSMMPVAKLKSNSKMLIADLDPEFPYHYNMPVKKEGTDN